jgi:molybdopterin converting factor small subunit
MIIYVKGYLTLKPIIGDEQLEYPDEIIISLQDLLDRLSHELGGEFQRIVYDYSTQKIGSNIAILINGSHYRHLPDKQNTILKNQDKISIFPPIAGG